MEKDNILREDGEARELDIESQYHEKTTKTMAMISEFTPRGATVLLETLMWLPVGRMEWRGVPSDEKTHERSLQ